MAIRGIHDMRWPKDVGVIVIGHWHNSLQREWAEAMGVCQRVR